METINYLKQAEDFLNETNSSLEVKFLKYDYHFPDDKEKRDIYKVTISRGNRKYSFNFGQSLNSSGQKWLYGDFKRGVSHSKGKAFVISFINPHEKDGKEGEIISFYSGTWDINKNYKIPSSYDILTCLEKYEVGSFEDFCSNFDYDTDSRKAEGIYKAVLNEYTQLCTLYSDKELEKMQEIQ